MPETGPDAIADLVVSQLPDEANDYPWQITPWCRLELEHRTGRRLALHVTVLPEQP